MDQQNEKPFSLEENLKQRAYYEKYYEELAAHASEMDKKGQHELAEDSRQEMRRVNNILGDLVSEKVENYDRLPIKDAQTDLEMDNVNQNEQSGQNMDHDSDLLKSPQEINQTAKDLSQAKDIPQEDLIPVDKSHFTDEALEAQARADADLAAAEEAMEETVEQYYAELDDQSIEPAGENAAKTSETAQEQQALDNTVESSENEEGESSSEEEDYYYGYGM